MVSAPFAREQHRDVVGHQVWRIQSPTATSDAVRRPRADVVGRGDTIDDEAVRALEDVDAARPGRATGRTRTRRRRCARAGTRACRPPPWRWRWPGCRPRIWLLGSVSLALSSDGRVVVRALGHVGDRVLPDATCRLNDERDRSCPSGTPLMVNLPVAIGDGRTRSGRPCRASCTTLHEAPVVMGLGGELGTYATMSVERVVPGRDRRRRR
jgi:hypothetical protein